MDIESSLPFTIQSKNRSLTAWYKNFENDLGGWFDTNDYLDVQLAPDLDY